MGKQLELIKQNKLLKWILIILASIIGLGLFGYALIIYLGSQIVNDDAFLLAETTTIETSEGEVIAELYEENRKYVQMEEIPSHVKDAYIAIEDRRFMNMPVLI